MYESFNKVYVYKVLSTLIKLVFLASEQVNYQTWYDDVSKTRTLPAFYSYSALLLLKSGLMFNKPDYLMKCFSLSCAIQNRRQLCMLLEGLCTIKRFLTKFVVIQHFC